MRGFDLMWPRRCPDCGELLAPGKHTCSCDVNHNERIAEDFCEHCGYAMDHCVCDEPYCIQLHHITAPYIYSGFIRQRLLDNKISHDRSYVRTFSHQMAMRFSKAFPDAKIDVVTFVPMTEAAIAKRSFNQSALIAQWVAKEKLIECKALLQKTRTTKNQHDLTRDERLHNLDGAFALTELFRPGKTVLLVDDIKTTGSTLRQCEELLLQGGAKDVYCLCCAISDYRSLDF